MVEQAGGAAAHIQTGHQGRLRALERKNQEIPRNKTKKWHLFCLVSWVAEYNTSTAHAPFGAFSYSPRAHHQNGNHIRARATRSRNGFLGRFTCGR